MAGARRSRVDGMPSLDLTADVVTLTQQLCDIESVSHDEGAVRALEPERVLLLPDGVEDLWGRDYEDLVALA